jgi:predicted ATPase
LRRAEGGERDLALRHGRLARALLASTPAPVLRESVFAIVQHFNAARATIDDPAERAQVARLDLLASREALRATAYGHARGYAEAGLAFLGDDGWRDALYDVARDLHLSRIWAEAFAGDAGEAERTFRAARANVRGEADRTALHGEWIRILTMRGQLRAAIDAGREHLRSLGVEMPETVTPEMLRAQRDAIRRLLGPRGAGALLALPDLASEVQEGAIRTLVALVPPAFFLDAALRAWIQMTVVLLSAQYGLCDAASYSVSGYGSLLRAVFEEHDEAASFGRAALALHDRFPDDRAPARILFHYGGWHASWVGPFAEAKAMLRRAHDLAREHGDTTHETYAATVLSVVTFCQSPSLAEVERIGAWATEIGLRRKDLDMAWAPEAHARFAAALRGTTARGTDLSRDGSSDEDFRARLGPKTPTALFYYFFCNAVLAYLAGDVARAGALLREAEPTSRVIVGLPTSVEVALLECLVAGKRHELESSGAEREALEACMSARVARIEGWARACPANFEPHVLLARAELARARGAAADPVAAYEAASVAARERGAPMREAIALERAGEIARGRGDVSRASQLSARAADAYRRWGAMAKADACASKSTGA